MSKQTTPTAPSENELHAYIDGEVSDARRLEIESYLAEHPDQAQWVQVYRDQQRVLHQLFDPVLDEPIPPEWTARLNQSTPRRRLDKMAIAAMLAMFMIGAIGGFAVRDYLRPPMATMSLQVADRAAVAHAVYAVEVLHPVEVTADQEAHLVQWLSKRLGHPLHTPDLGSFGYQLIGGRLLPGDAGAAAQFMYQDQSGSRLTLYVAVNDQESGQTAFEIQERSGVPVLSWIDGKLAFALTAKEDRSRLLSIARVTYEAMSF